LIIGTVILADQWLKIWVKLTMEYGEQRSIFGDWVYLHFIENRGMAFGIEFGGDTGKLMLSLFRVVVLIVLGVYLYSQTKAKAHKGLIASLALIFAGALGNIIDSALYGLIFSKAQGGVVAQFMPADGGYASFLHGHVVDMFSVRLYDGFFPGWLPVWGGERFEFFKPIFNIADMAISCGVIILVLFQRSFFAAPEQTVVEAEIVEAVPAAEDPLGSGQQEEE